MRLHGPLSPYNRIIAQRRYVPIGDPGTTLPDLGKSILGKLAADETQLIVALAKWAGVDYKGPVKSEWQQAAELYSAIEKAPMVYVDPMSRKFQWNYLHQKVDT